MVADAEYWPVQFLLFQTRSVRRTKKNDEC
jgi:hypothetical protein